jgi:hypothetical protein
LTERQQHWLDHIQAAEAFDGSVADYARSEGLKPKELYSWKGILARRGLLGDAVTDDNSGGFVCVIVPARPMGMSLVLKNGIRLEWHSDLGPEQLEALLLTASRLTRQPEPQPWNR